MDQTKSFKLDVLKTIALLSVILAHVCNNNYINQIRSFDVPLFVFISGYLGIISYEKNKKSIKYIIKRFKRLLCPTYFFLTAFFLIWYLISIITNISYPFPLREGIIRSYLLLDGIGMVWAIRVYLLCAMMIPVISYIYDYFKNKKMNYKNYLVIIVLIFVNELLRRYEVYNLNWFTNYILSYMISYGIVIYLGAITYKLNLSRKKTCIISFVFLFVYLILAYRYYLINNIYVFTQSMKYPPSLYYLSYALFIIYILFTIRTNFLFDKTKYTKKIIKFMSSNSIYIYLWHTFFLYIFMIFYPSFNWKIKYIIVVILTMSVIALYKILVKFWSKNRVITKFDYYKKQIFLNKYIYSKLFGKEKMIMKYYEIFHGYSYDFYNPKTFSEKINTRKLDENSLFIKCANKLDVREYVSKKIGDKYLIPLYFSTNKLTSKNYEKIPEQCVLKTASGSGTIHIIKNKCDENKKYILKLMSKFQKVKFEYIWGEMFYKYKKNPIICEKLLLDSNGNVPSDYKFHCFNNKGKTKIFVQVDFSRFEHHTRNIYDENLKYINMKISDLENNLDLINIRKPKNYNEMLKVAKKLSEDFDYVRVDLYNLDGKIYFGELTFTHGAGLEKFYPNSKDKEWGTYWK